MHIQWIPNGYPLISMDLHVHLWIFIDIWISMDPIMLHPELIPLHPWLILLHSGLTFPRFSQFYCTLGWFLRFFRNFVAPWANLVALHRYARSRSTVVLGHAPLHGYGYPMHIQWIRNGYTLISMDLHVHLWIFIDIWISMGIHRHLWISRSTVTPT